MFNDLSGFLSELEKNGELTVVDAPVSRDLEISEIARRVVKANGPALLFRNVEGCNIPVAINLFGSETRIAIALGRPPDSIAGDIEKILKFRFQTGLLEKLRMIPMLAKLAKYPPKTTKSAPCQQVIKTGDKVNLDELPILRCWPKDGGRYVTIADVITDDPETGAINHGMYRLQIYNRNTTGMHWQMHHDGAKNCAAYKTRGKRMPVCVAVGGDPAMMYAATAPMPPGVDEAYLAGFIRGKGVRYVKAVTQPLNVPASSEIVLEGYVDPEELADEGPFGDHTGFYTPSTPSNVFHITAITHRKNPVYQTIVVGHPVMEDTFLGKATERIFRPFVNAVLPEVTDYCLPDFGIFHNCAIFAVRGSYPAQGKKVLCGVWGLGQLMFTKWAIAVDSDCDVRDWREPMWRAAAFCDFDRDTVFVEGPVDELDHSAPLKGAGGKMGWDATRKGLRDGRPVPFPEKIPAYRDDPASRLAALKAIPGVVDAHIPSFAFVNNTAFLAVDKSKAKPMDIARAAWKTDAAKTLKWISFFDAGVDIRNEARALFYMASNADFRRDILRQSGMVDPREFCGTDSGVAGKIAVDATSKVPADGHSRPWPEELSMSEEIVERVTRRAEEYGLKRWLV